MALLSDYLLHFGHIFIENEPVFAIFLYNERPFVRYVYQDGEFTNIRKMLHSMLSFIYDLDFAAFSVNEFLGSSKCLSYAK